MTFALQWIGMGLAVGVIFAGMLLVWEWLDRRRPVNPDPICADKGDPT